MPLIDEDGALFGVVNVIDALAIVLVIAVLVAGVTVVSSGDDDTDEPEPSGEPATRYATIELDPQPDYVTDQFNEGDVVLAWGWNAGGDFTVTDVYVAPPAVTEVNERGSSVILRTAVNGTVFETDQNQTQFQVGGEPLLLGSNLRVSTGSYIANGTVTDIGREDRTLPVEETTTVADVELRNVTPTVEAGLEEGLSETANGESIATITNVESEPAAVVVRGDDGTLSLRDHPRNRDVTVTVELRTTETETGVRFRGEQLGVGTTVTLDFGTVTVEGDVSRVE